MADGGYISHCASCDRRLPAPAFTADDARRLREAIRPGMRLRMPAERRADQGHIVSLTGRRKEYVVTGVYRHLITARAAREGAVPREVSATYAEMLILGIAPGEGGGCVGDEA